MDELLAAQQQRLFQQAIAKGLDTAPTIKTPFRRRGMSCSDGSSNNITTTSIPPPPAVTPDAMQCSPNLSTAARKSHRKRSNSVTSVGSIDEATAKSAIATTASTQQLPLHVQDGTHLFETRQFDYKHSTNPLFQALGEDERIALLTSDKAEIHVEPQSNANPLTDVNNEIKLLKASRDSGGCSCKHTKADKLSVAKMKSELLAKGHWINFQGSAEEVEKLPKSELTRLVKDVLKVCMMCVANDCQCVQFGVQCSAQLCGCMRGGGRKCANPNGFDMYEPDRVNEYRFNILRDLQASSTAPCTPCPTLVK